MNLRGAATGLAFGLVVGVPILLAGAFIDSTQQHAARQERRAKGKVAFARDSAALAIEVKKARARFVERYRCDGESLDRVGDVAVCNSPALEEAVDAMHRSCAACHPEGERRRKDRYGRYSRDHPMDCHRVERQIARGHPVDDPCGDL